MRSNRFQIINAKTGYVFAANLTSATCGKYLGFLYSHYKDVVFTVLPQYGK